MDLFSRAWLPSQPRDPLKVLVECYTSPCASCGTQCSRLNSHDHGNDSITPTTGVTKSLVLTCGHGCMEIKHHSRHKKNVMPPSHLLTQPTSRDCTSATRNSSIESADLPRPYRLMLPGDCSAAKYSVLTFCTLLEINTNEAKRESET